MLGTQLCVTTRRMMSCVGKGLSVGYVGTHLYQSQLAMLQVMT